MTSSQDLSYLSNTCYTSNLCLAPHCSTVSFSDILVVKSDLISADWSLKLLEWGKNAWCVQFLWLLLFPTASYSTPWVGMSEFWKDLEPFFFQKQVSALSSSSSPICRLFLKPEHIQLLETTASSIKEEGDHNLKGSWEQRSPQKIAQEANQRAWMFGDCIYLGAICTCCFKTELCWLGEHIFSSLTPPIDSTI